MQAVALLFLMMALAQADPVYHPGTTRKIVQLTGDVDGTLQIDTPSQTLTDAGVAATDLGSSFEHDGQLYFLFGDTQGIPANPNADTIAHTTASEPTDLAIEFVKDLGGTYLPITIPGISQGAYEVPSHGLSIGSTMYIAHTTQWYGPTGNMERAVLAKSTDDGRTWTYRYDLSRAEDHDMANAHFINVYFATVDAEDYPGDLPYATGRIVLIWGSGAYRNSSPRLACIPESQIETPQALRYFSGTDGAQTPLWSSQQADAVPLFEHDRVGEFSVAWVEPVQRWVFLYNALVPRGITMRTAALPWGPYSNGDIILEPWNDGAYGEFMHVSWDFQRRDAVHDPGRAYVWGGEYAPYIIPRYTSGDADRCQIYYTLSTWNPYEVILVRSEIGTPPATSSTEPQVVTLTPGSPEWQRTSDDFFVPFTRLGIPHITTFAAQGDSNTGMMWRWLPRQQSAQRLTFSVHGGHAKVFLLEGGPDLPSQVSNWTQFHDQIRQGLYGRVVKCTWGHDTNDFDVTVEWHLTPLDNQNLKIVILDHVVDAWGFISVSQMTLTVIPPPAKGAGEGEGEGEDDRSRTPL